MTKADPVSAADSTRERILDAAEALFAERGFAMTPLRLVTRQANANIAAVNYHFGSKDALLQALFERRLLPLNRERMARLERLRAGPQPIELEALIRAFIEPALELTGNGVPFVRLIGRSYGEAGDALRDYIHQQYREVLDRFRHEVAATLPWLPNNELRWRLQFLLGAASYSMGGIDLMRLVASCELSDTDNRQALLQRLVTFLAAGLRAAVDDPATHTARQQAAHQPATTPAHHTTRQHATAEMTDT